MARFRDFKWDTVDIEPEDKERVSKYATMTACQASANTTIA